MDCGLGTEFLPGQVAHRDHQVAFVLDLADGPASSFPAATTRPRLWSGACVMAEIPEVLFVCTHNAGRSQMAAALLNQQAAGRIRVTSAGSQPASAGSPSSRSGPSATRSAPGFAR
ncbi:MAG TPA: hypothetical protein VFV73_35625 [Streptosporangiaceae bacterium]|nr:hypothetical protein [Streptosporangiaceae bacterium]